MAYKNIKDVLMDYKYPKWKHKKASDYKEKLVKVFGEPFDKAKTSCKWKNIDGFSEVEIKDENIPHDFPMKHDDFVYSSRKLKLEPDQVAMLNKATGSIFYDGLKKEVTARCGALIKNAVSIGFAEDVAKGKIKSWKAKDEYARRIKANETPSWYKNKIKD